MFIFNIRYSFLIRLTITLQYLVAFRKDRKRSESYSEAGWKEEEEGVKLAGTRARGAECDVGGGGGGGVQKARPSRISRSGASRKAAGPQSF